MAKVQVLVCNRISAIDLYTNPVNVLVQTALENNQYVCRGKSFEVDLVGEAAADEVFDLTNNPSRQEEREEKYGNDISVSVAHIVKVDESLFVCMPCGWQEL